MPGVIRLRRSTAIIVLVIIFGLMALLVAGYSDLRSLHHFDARRNYDVCRGTNAQIYRTVERLVQNSTPERKADILEVVQQGETDCNVYKVNP
jgi:hypothetical protein